MGRFEDAIWERLIIVNGVVCTRTTDSCLKR